MGCKACGRKKKPAKRSRDYVSQQISLSKSLDFTLLGTKMIEFKALDRKTYRIDMPLTKMRPLIGYQVKYLVGTIEYSTQETKPKDIVAEIVETYEANDISVTPIDVWYNLNLVWVERVPKNMVYATRDFLEKIGEMKKEPPIWYRKTWLFIENIIESEGFNLMKFHDALKKLYDIANDGLTGCEVCYDKIKESKPYDIDKQADARTWYEEISKEIVRYEEE